jgi:hypothetical protein
MLKKVIVVVLVAIAAGLAYASTKPDTMHVQRSIGISAPADRIYPLIADFRQWARWSPWEHLDPAMTRTLSGAASGKGAIYEWQGNSDVGSGRMEIADTVEPSKVTIQLDFLEPFEAHNVTEFRLEPSGSVTNVIWTMDGPSPFMMKVMSLFMNMDSMIGADFEKGLAALKTEAEK